MDNIEPSDELISLLLSLNCLTEEESQRIQRHRFNRHNKNYELIHILRTFDEIKFTNLVKCLRKTNQKTVARIIENGGGFKYKLYQKLQSFRPTVLLHFRQWQINIVAG